MGEVIDFPSPNRGWWSARPWFTTTEVGHLPWRRMDRCTKSLDRIGLWRGMPHIVRGSTQTMLPFSAVLGELIRLEFPMQRWSTLLYDRQYPVALFRCADDAKTFSALLDVLSAKIGYVLLD